MSQVNYEEQLRRIVNAMLSTGSTIGEILAIVVEGGTMPLTDEQKKQVKAYRARSAEIARKARKVRGNPTGPRQDEWDGIEKPVEVRGGETPDPQPTGPRVEWQAQTNGTWISNGNGSERFVPSADWEPSRVETQEREPSVPAIAISPRPWRMTASGPVQD